MKMRDRFVLLTTACTLAAMAATGCEDSAAQRRADAQEQIVQAGRELAAATAVPVSPGDASFEPTRQKLRSVISTVGGIREGEAGQQAAASLLAATAHRSLAAMSLAQAAEIEARHRRIRFLLNSGIDAAMRLEALAAGRESISSDIERALLDQGRQEAQETLGEYSRRMAELDGPIAERENQNEQDSAQAARLNEQANVLRREASELGHADGLSRFEQAVLLERQADRFEYEIAQRDNDLRHDLEPERNLAASKVEHLQTLLGQIDATRYALDQREQRTVEDVQAMRGDIRELRERIHESLAIISGATAGELTTLYEQAADDLGQTVAKARQAASRGARGSDAARLVVARAYELQGQLLWSQARGLADHIALLQRLVDAGEALGPAERFRTELQAAAGRHDEALEGAKTAFEAAKQQLLQVSGSAGRAEVEAFKRGLDVSLALISGEPIEAPPDAAPAMTPGSGGAAAAGFATPEELIAMINAVQPGDLDAAARILDFVHTSSPEARSLIEAQRSMLEPARDLMNAISEQFGDAASQSFNTGMAGGMGATMFQNAQIQSRSEDRITVSYDSGGMPGGTFDVILLDGSWLIDGDSTVADMDPATARQTVGAMATFREMMTGFAARIRAGEFATQDAAFQAIMTEMMGLMGQMGAAGAGQ